MTQRRKKRTVGVCKWNIYEKKYFCTCLFECVFVFSWLAREPFRLSSVCHRMYSIRNACISFLLVYLFSSLFAAAGSQRFYLFFVRQHLYYKIFFLWLFLFSIFFISRFCRDFYTQPSSLSNLRYIFISTFLCIRPFRTHAKCEKDFCAMLCTL